jgi:hypothetical protein
MPEGWPAFHPFGSESENASDPKHEIMITPSRETTVLKLVDSNLQQPADQPD